MSLHLRASQVKDQVTALANKPWMQYVWLLLITLLAAALRFYRLGTWSFWIDEIYSINRAMRQFSSLELLLQHIPPSSSWIPLSFILEARALNVGGINEWSARLAPAIIGVLTIPILYFPTRKAFGSRIALISLLFLALSPWHLFWSQNARFYTSLMFLYTLALFAFYFGIEEDRPGYLFVFWGLVYLAASERLSALFILPVVLVYLAALWILKFDRPRGLNFRNLLILIFPLLIGGAIELYSEIAHGESWFFSDLSWVFQYQVDDPFRLLLFIGNNIGIPLAVLALFSGIFLLRARSRPGLLMFVSAAVPLLMLLLANPFVFTKDRYVFLTLFSWIILVVVGITEIAARLQGNSRWLAVAVFFVLVASALNGLLLYFGANNGDRLPWKTAFAYVEEHARDQDTIVSFWPEFHPYYVARPITAFEDVDLKSMLASHERYWFVLDSETIWTNGELKTWLEKNADLIDVWYLRRPENNFLRVYLVDPVRTPDP